MTNEVCEAVTKGEFSGNEVRLVTSSPRKARPTPLLVKMLRLGFRVGEQLSPKLAGKVAAKIWFAPVRFPTPVSEKNALQSADLRYESIGPYNIATYRWSRTEWDVSEPIVLLVHGWSGRGTQLGTFVNPLLEAGYRVLSFDAPAHGKSNGKNTTLYEIADVISALSAKYGHFHALVTHSFGGMCAALALRRGLMVNSMVCISPPISVSGLVDKFSTSLHIREKTTRYLSDILEKRFGQSVWLDMSMENNVRQIDIPGLVIHDLHDEDVPSEEGRAVAQAWDNAVFMETIKLGHRRILRNTHVINASIEFIKKDRSTT